MVVLHSYHIQAYWGRFPYKLYGKSSYKVFGTRFNHNVGSLVVLIFVLPKFYKLEKKTQTTGIIKHIRVFPRSRVGVPTVGNVRSSG